MITNLIIGAIIVAILGAVILYIVSEKKKGTKCIGCASAKNCSPPKDKVNNNSCGGCH